MKIIFSFLLTFIFLSSSFPQDSLKNVKSDPKAKEIYSKYIDAIGGAAVMKNVQYKFIFMKATMQGMDLKIKLYQKAPNKLRTETEFSGMEQVIVFDGEKAWSKMNDKTMEITGDQLEQLKLESNVCMPIMMDELGVIMQYAGEEKVDGKDAYKIIFKKNDLSWNSYFEKGTYLKIRDEKELVTPQGNFNMVTLYSDYKDFNGIKIAYKMTQKVGPQTIEMQILVLDFTTPIPDDKFIL